MTEERLTKEQKRTLKSKNQSSKVWHAGALLFFIVTVIVLIIERNSITLTLYVIPSFTMIIMCLVFGFDATAEAAECKRTFLKKDQKPNERFTDHDLTTNT